MDKNYILEFDGISKAFPGVLALDNVSFGIVPGVVHVIMGENGAGKSTLMKIINGSYEETEGKMLLNGKQVSFKSPRSAQHEGIGMVYQELKYLPDFTVERYLMLGREPGKYGCIHWKNLSKMAKNLLEESELSYDLKTTMRALSISDIQLLEITKVISTDDCKIIIMDEPTSALSNREIDRLFEKIQKLKEKGITILYISHKMDEIFKIADYITVMRDGAHIKTAPASEYTPDSLVQLMVGRSIKNVYPKEDAEITDVAMEVRNLTVKSSRIYDINFNVKKGEIVGLAGLMGAGRTEVVRAIVGLDKKDSGEVFVGGKKVNIQTVADASNVGIAMATEDRRRYGLVLCRNIKENISMGNLKKMSKFGFIQLRKEHEKVGGISKRLRVKAAGLFSAASTLSGGNQQKVVLSRCLLSGPKVLILDEPTRGIDVGAKFEIYKLIVEMAKSGIAIIMISSELPEFIGMCDRAYTMYNGKITGEISRDDFSQEEIMKMITSSNIE